MNRFITILYLVLLAGCASAWAQFIPATNLPTAGSWQGVAGVLGGILGALLASILNHWLTIRRERRSGIGADKKSYLASLHGLIDSAKACDTPNMVRCEIRRALYDSHARFRQHLNYVAVRRSLIN